jgi:hypothetical protein
MTMQYTWSFKHVKKSAQEKQAAASPAQGMSQQGEPKQANGTGNAGGRHSVDLKPQQQQQQQHQQQHQQQQKGQHATADKPKGKHDTKQGNTNKNIDKNTSPTSHSKVTSSGNKNGKVGGRFDALAEQDTLILRDDGSDISDPDPTMKLIEGLDDMPDEDLAEVSAKVTAEAARRLSQKKPPPLSSSTSNPSSRSENG